MDAKFQRRAVHALDFGMTQADQCIGCGKVTAVFTPDTVAIKEFFFCSSQCAALFDVLHQWKPERGRKPQ